MSRRFEGRNALVTGASSGIGAATARAFAREGASVALLARSEPALSGVAAEIRRDGGKAFVIRSDVSDHGSLSIAVERAAAELGGIDILVNNAGVNHRGPIEEWSAEDLVQIVEVNLTAPIVLSRLVLPHMRRRGVGAIVNVASLAGRVPLRHEAVYSATKFALRVFSFALDEELSSSGIRVSVVSPGPVDTGFIMNAIEEVPDIVFAQPMSSSQGIAAMILDCAADGRAERATPWLSGYLATLGYLFPVLRRNLMPLMQKRGQKAKAAHRRKFAIGGGPG